MLSFSEYSEQIISLLKDYKENLTCKVDEEFLIRLHAVKSVSEKKRLLDLIEILCYYLNIHKDLKGFQDQIEIIKVSVSKTDCVEEIDFKSDTIVWMENIIYRYKTENEKQRMRRLVDERYA